MPGRFYCNIYRSYNNISINIFSVLLPSLMYASPMTKEHCEAICNNKYERRFCEYSNQCNRCRNGNWNQEISELFNERNEEMCEICCGFVPPIPKTYEYCQSRCHLAWLSDLPTVGISAEFCQISRDCTRCNDRQWLKQQKSGCKHCCGYTSAEMEND